MTVNELAKKLEELKNSGRGDNEVVVDTGNTKCMLVDDIFGFLYSDQVCISAIE